MNSKIFTRQDIENPQKNPHQAGHCHGGEIENPQKKCFITGERIEDGDLSIDHVIPWSYIYSDDLWNLVFVSKSQNSSKGNRIPSEQMIEKLCEKSM